MQCEWLYIYGQGIRPPMKQTEEVLCMQLMLPPYLAMLYCPLENDFLIEMLQGLNVIYATVNDTTFSIIAHCFLPQPSSSTSGTRGRTSP